MRLQLPAILGLTYFLSELILCFSRRSSGSAVSKDSNSLRIIWFTIILSLWLGLLVQARWRTGMLPAWFVPIGVVVFVLGLVLRWYSIIHLGRFFTVNVAIAADHQLVDTGPYRFVRHPSYTGALLAFVGFAMVKRNWVSVLVIAIPISLAFLNRIKVEERALIEALGERYLAYIQRTKRLIPLIY